MSDDDMNADDAPSPSSTDGDQPDDRWYVLVHTPGPSLPEGTSIFAHPAFADHLAFLRSLDERGWLVAAGPTKPESGEGMTIIRVPDAAGVVDVDLLATTEDRCVAEGYLSVAVGIWHVAMRGV